MKSSLLIIIGIVVILGSLFGVAGIIYLGANTDKTEIIEEVSFISNQKSSEQDKSVFSNLKCTRNALGNMICMQR